MNLFEAAFCGSSHEAQQAGRAALRVGDEVAVMVTNGRWPLCQVFRAIVQKADTRYVVVSVFKFHRSTGKASRQKQSARVSRTLYAITPEVEAWFKAKKRKQ